MTDDRRSDWQLIDDALRVVEAHRPVDVPRYRRLTLLLLGLLGVAVVVLAWRLG